VLRAARCLAELGGCRSRLREMAQARSSATAGACPCGNETLPSPNKRGRNGLSLSILTAQPVPDPAATTWSQRLRSRGWEGQYHIKLTSGALILKTPPPRVGQPIIYFVSEQTEIRKTNNISLSWGAAAQDRETRRRLAAWLPLAPVETKPISEQVQTERIDSVRALLLGFARQAIWQNPELSRHPVQMPPPGRTDCGPGGRRSTIPHR
jgi:hypothetical protein